MSNVKKFLSLADSMVTTTNQKRQEIKDEGKTKEWENKQYNELLKKTMDSSDKITKDMIEVANSELQEARNTAKKTRVKPGNNLKPTDSAAKLYHQNNAKMALDGLSEEEALKAYPRIIDNLTEQEREECLHVYEDVLMSRMKGEGDRIMAEQEMFKHKSPEEKVALVGVKRADDQLKKVEGIANIFLHDIEEIASGKKESPGYDYTSLFDEPTKREKEGMSKFEEAMKPSENNDDGTPYDGGSNDHPDLH